jgi:uncharacterized membrane protein
LRSLRLRHFLHTSIWLVPLVCLLAGVGLGIATLAIDRAHGYRLVSEGVVGSASAVEQILSTTAASLVSLTSLVLSLTLVAVQLAMGQFSPRIVAALLSDRRSQAAIGLFLAAFTQSIMALRQVDSQSGRVPGLSVLVAYALTLASIGALVLYVHHAGQSLRVAGLIDLVGDSTREQIDRTFSKTVATLAPAADDVVVACAPGVVVHLDRDGLVDAAREAHCVLEMVPRMGDFVPGGGALFRVRGATVGDLRRDVCDLVIFGAERTHEEDPSYGIRKLVDIAERSIASSPFDDPTTAVQAIDRIHDCLRLLSVREFPTGEHRDRDGNLRLVTPELDWEAYVRLAFDEVRLVGAPSPQVARRLRAALDDLKAVAPDDRRPPLDRQVELLEAAAGREYDDEADVSAALTGDRQGVGSGSDLLRPRG